MTRAEGVVPVPRPWKSPGPAALRMIGMVRTLDTELAIQLRCPGCGHWGEIDDDQLHGRVSVDHDDPRCGYHETHDFAAEAIWMENDTSRMYGWGPWQETRDAHR